MITVKVTNCTIVESEMVVLCQTTNTAQATLTHPEYHSIVFLNANKNVLEINEDRYVK